MARPRIGLALGGGSARGWAHLGVLDSLIAAGIEPDIVCGTSIGALVGAAYVSGRHAVLRQWAASLTWREMVGLMDVRLSGGGLIDGRNVVKFLQEAGVTGAIERCAQPFAAVATDLATGAEVWLRSGAIEDAVRASIALPGIFSPVQLEGRWLLDGGLVNPVPVSVCRALGADVIIAVNLNSGLVGRSFKNQFVVGRAAARTRARTDSLTGMLGRLPVAMREQAAQIAARLQPQRSSKPGYFDVIANAVYIMQEQITRTRLAEDRPEVTLTPHLSQIGLLEFNRASEAIAEGSACVERAMPVLQQYA